MRTKKNVFPGWMKAALAAVLLALLAGGAWFYKVQEQEQRRQVESQLDAIARLKADQIADWRKERLDDAAVLMDRLALIADAKHWLTRPTAKTAEEILRRFRSLRKHYRYHDLLLVDLDGKVRLSLTSYAGTHHRGASEALAGALRDRKPVFTDLHTEQDDPTPHIGVVAPFFANHGEAPRPLGAVILVSSAREFLYPMIQSWPVPSRTAETLLVRRDGDDALVLNDIRFHKDAALKLRIPLSRTDVPAVMAVLGKEGFVQGKALRGVDVVAVIKPIPDSPWFMVAKVDAAEAFAVWRFRSVLILALLLGFVVLAGAAGLVAWQRNQKAHYRALFQSEAALRASVERHSITLKSIGYAVIAIDGQGLVELLNSVAEALTGWKNEEARGQPLEQVFCIVNEETRDNVENPVARVLREGLVVGLANHTLLIARDGTERPIADSGASIRDEQGNITGVVLVFRDQTEERRAEKTLRQSEEKYQILVETTNTGFLILNAYGKVIDANQDYVRLTGHDTLEEILGRSVVEWIAPYDLERNAREVEKCAAQGFVRNLEIDYVSRSGQITPIEINASVVGSGDSTRILSLCRDITERKQAEEALHTSEGKYRQLFNTVPDAVMLLDGKTLQFIDVNDSALSLYGYSREEFLKLKQPETSGQYEVSVHTLLKILRGEVCRVPIRYHKKKDGTKFPVEVSAGNFMLEGRPVVFLCARDITERKQAETALRESEEKHRSMMEAMADPAYICSPDFRIEYMNPAMARRIGRDATGELCHKEIHGLDEKCPWCVHGEVLQGEHIKTEVVSPKDGNSYHISNSPIFHTDGSISKLTIFHDITATKKMEEQIRQSQKMESIGTVAGGIAHDFNNILSPIMGYAELALYNLPENSPFRNNIKEIIQGAKRASDLVKQILAFSRQSGQELKPLKVQLVIKEVLKLIRSSIPTTIEIKQDISMICGYVLADPTQIHQIAMNLMTNAYHAMEDEGGKLEVTLKEVELGVDDLTDQSMTPGAYVCLTVADTGHGMDQSVISRIFDPYFTTKESGKGTGLGLAVVHGIVKSYKGDIKVYSEPGKGTAFHVYLPVIKSQVGAEKINAAVIIQTGTERILLVDDEDSIVRMEKQMLEQLGYQVAARTSSIEALEAFRAAPDKFDLVITDMTMPNMTGIQLSQKLLEIRPDIPIIICTGFSNKLDNETATAAGIRGFVMKPVVMSELAKKIRELLEQD